MYKQGMKKILKHLHSYEMGQDVQTTFNKMLNELEITYEDYIKAVRIQ